MAKKKQTKQYWLVKTEPGDFSVDDFAAAPNKTTHWDGVRNYQARNMLRDQFKKGDEVLVYHSNAKPPAVVGIARVIKEGYPDFTAFDKNDPHYDPKSDPDQPRWFMVDLKLTRRFKHPLPLEDLRQIRELADMELLRKGSRLSVQPVRAEEFDVVVRAASEAKG